jgi:predicted AAA+ superfamily ATPase
MWEYIFIRDYLFLDGERKYSYHWQNELKECLVRCDNAQHHQEISTYPFHKHIVQILLVFTHYLISSETIDLLSC